MRLTLIGATSSDNKILVGRSVIRYLSENVTIFMAAVRSRLMYVVCSLSYVALSDPATGLLSAVACSADRAAVFWS